MAARDPEKDTATEMSGSPRAMTRVEQKKRMATM